MTVSSRIFGIKINNKKTDVFAPLADMLNHREPRQTQWFYSDLHKSFLIQAIDSIEKGDEIFDSYGKKCNSRFLLNYGFVLENNDSNEFPITVEISENDPLYYYKSQILKKTTRKTFKVQEGFREMSILHLLSFLRLYNFQGDVGLFLNVIHKNR